MTLATRRLPALLALLALCLTACGTRGVTNADLGAPAVSTPFAATARIALAGNAFVTNAPASATETIGSSGLTGWTSPDAITTAYVRLSTPGTLTVALRARVADGTTSVVQVRVNGTPFTVRLGGARDSSYVAGSVPVTATGYVAIALQGVSRTGASFGDVSAIEVAGSATATGMTYANDSANYYWSRRGPSVHLRYATPDSTDYFYSEITVPDGEDQVGSYFMANGFSQGYMGIQVNSATERRVLFSVWDDPGGAATTLVAGGPGVVTRGFSGEGTGGQSYLVFDWRAGLAYRFLTRARPDGAGSTNFSAWFGAPGAPWRLIATWKRPNVSTTLTGVHSFLENFIDRNGWLGRSAQYHDQWACTTSGRWVEVTQATLSADATAKNAQRMDYAGGVANGAFFLRNGGFFAEPVAAGQRFTRAATGMTPAVDVNALP